MRPTSSSDRAFFIVLAAVVLVALLVTLALCLGHNGAIFGTGTGAIGGIVGWYLRTLYGRRGGKTHKRT